MEESWDLKASHGPIRSLTSIPLSAGVHQSENGGGQFYHPYVQQELCFIARTFRQEALGVNSLITGLQGPSIKSVGDDGNSLMALVSGPQYQCSSSYEPVPSLHTTLATSIPQTYPMGSVTSAGVSSWPGHFSSFSGNMQISAGGSLGSDSSLNVLAREMNLSMFGREVNLFQCSKMTAGQDCVKSSFLRSGGDDLRQNGVHDIGNELNGQSLFPLWLTEIVSRSRVQDTQVSPVFPSGRSSPLTAEPSHDVGTNSLPPLASFTVRGGRVFCTNYDTGERIGGELCLTQLGLLGVVCSCHGCHMSVARFTEHVGLFSSNPGNVVMMDGSGESLIQWRRMFFSSYGVKIPEDNQGWDWIEGHVWDSGPSNCKAVVTQSWQNEVDVSSGGEPVYKSRVSHVWDASLSPGTAASLQMSRSLTNIGLPSSFGEGAPQDSTEGFLKGFGRALEDNSIEFGLCSAAIENLPVSVGSSQEFVDMHSLGNQTQFGTTQSGEFFNFMSCGQQVVSAHIEQQAAAEHLQTEVGSRSTLKGLNLACDSGGESFQQEKDGESLSSFELRLGQPSEQSQPLGLSLSSSLASQMQRVMQRVLECRKQKDMLSTSSCELPIFSVNQGFSNEYRLNQNMQNLERTSYVEPSHHICLRVDPPTDVEVNGSHLLDLSSLKRMEEVSEYRYSENLRGRENMMSRDASLLPAEGIWMWPGTVYMGRTSKSGSELFMDSEHCSKHFENEIQRPIVVAARSLPEGQQDLDSIVDQGWMSETHTSQKEATEQKGDSEGREGQACSGRKLTPSSGDCTPLCRETCGQGEQHCMYEDMDVSQDMKEGQECDSLNCGKSTTAYLNGRRVSELGEHPEVCMDGGDVDGSQMETLGVKLTRDAMHGPTAFDCSSPRIHCLRFFQALTSQRRSCVGGSVDDRLIQSSRVLSLVGSSPPPLSAFETDSGVDKTCKNSQDNIRPPRSQKGDHLVDPAAKSHTAIAVSSGVSGMKQPVRDVFSKSSANVLTRLSDDIAEEDVSNHQNEIKSEVVDEGSQIGKCSSSDGLNMGLAPNFSLKNEMQKYAPPSSEDYPFINTEESLAEKLGKRSRVGCKMKEPVSRQVDTGKVEKNWRRTRKYKSLGAPIGVADANKQKLSAAVTVRGKIGPLPRPIQESNASNCMENKKVVLELTPRTLGKPGAVKFKKVTVTNRFPVLTNQAEESDDTLNGVNALDIEGETPVNRVPQGVNCKKLKHGKHSKLGKNKPDIILTSRLMEQKKMVALNNLRIREAAVAGFSISESATPPKVSSSTPSHTANLQPVTIGRVILGRPSPRNATRMVSLNAIMRKPMVMTKAVPGDNLEASASECGCSPMISLKASTSNNGFTSSHKNAVKSFSHEDDSEVSHLSGVCKASLLHSSHKALSVSECVKVSSLKDGLKCPNPEIIVSKEGRKLECTSLKGGCGVSSPNASLRICPDRDGFSVSSPVDGLKASDTKEDFKVKVRILKNVSMSKGSSKDSSAKSCMKLPAMDEDFKTQYLDDLKASSCFYGTSNSVEDIEKMSIMKKNFKTPSFRDGWGAPVSVDSIKSVFARDLLKPSLHKDVGQAGDHSNGLKAGAPKDRQKSFAAKNPLRGVWATADAWETQVSQHVSNSLVSKEAHYPPASLNALAKTKIEGKGPKRQVSGVSVEILQKKDCSPATKALTESNSLSKSLKHEVQKVRNISELTGERKRRKPGYGVLEFHHRLGNSSQVLNQDVYDKTARQSGLDFPVPLQFTDSQCFVRQGGRSQSSKQAKVKNLFLQEGSDGHTSQSKPAPAFILRQSLENSLLLKAGGLNTSGKKTLPFPSLSPVRTRVQNHKQRRKHEMKDTNKSSSQMASSLVVKEMMKEFTSHTKPLPLKRFVGELGVLGSPSPFKKQKLIERIGTLEPQSGMSEKIICPLPRYIPATPTLPTSNYSVQPESQSIKCRVLETEQKSAKRKKRCHRPHWAGCRVPGVAECCVCGSSISEFFNQLVCCGRCPVKVHQACYGVKKIPNSAWLCRTCKADATHPICVLCGYGEGAMTRAQKAKGFVKGLVKVWQEEVVAKEMGEVCTPHSTICQENCLAQTTVDHSKSVVQVTNGISKQGIHEGKEMGGLAMLDSILPNGYPKKNGNRQPEENWMTNNTVTSGAADLTAVQWVHMVCALWMPGTRCLNFGTMGVFDVSGVAHTRRKLICSICNRKGGACIQCRVAKCNIPFHAWCAHQQKYVGLLYDGFDKP